VKAREAEVLRPFAARDKAVRKLEGDERKAATAELQVEKRAAVEAALSEEELFILDHGISNRGFHYWGSAKFFARIGEAFARALAGMED
jgi:hypothetical protein